MIKYYKTQLCTVRGMWVRLGAFVQIILYALGCVIVVEVIAVLKENVLLGGGVVVVIVLLLPLLLGCLKRRLDKLLD